MAKKNKVQLPVVVDMDVLSTLTDEELSARYSMLISDYNRASTSNADTTPWEVELAYVIRESQVREHRRIRHQDYLRDEQAWYEAEAHREALLPWGDFDNRRYVELCEGRVRR